MLLSIVIITKNEATVIGKTLHSLQPITDDIIIVDSGSTDSTVAICKQFNTTIIETTWQGYGINKNIGIGAAKYDWILSLDADEVIDGELQQSLAALKFSDINIVYNLKFKTYFGNKWIKYGEWAGDEHIRLFHKKNVRWNNAEVHETLQIPTNTKVITLKGFVHHYTVNSLDEYVYKIMAYAKLNAEKYYRKQKKATIVQLWIAPCFTFVQHYVFRLGFLDGWEGYCIAKTTAWYTFLKYAYLKNLNKQQKSLTP